MHDERPAQRNPDKPRHVLTETSKQIRIAVDAMGGDYAPACVVQGAVVAVRERAHLHVTLVGHREAIQAELQKLGPEGSQAVASGRLAIAHATEVIDMHDSPTAAVKTKKDSSIAVGLRLHHAGEVQAFVSAGNTGAMLSASTLILGRLQGVGRPTIGAIIPSATHPVLLIDAGANVDCKPRHLYEFAVMGSIYVAAMLNIPRPAVGLLNIGEEDSKGNEAAQEAHKLLAASGLNFRGNMEGRDVLRGEIDVIVCDGFVGNILLKFGESIPSFFKAKFTALAARSTAKKLIALVARNSLRSILRELDYQEAGGVPVLGVNGVSIIGHGRSTPKAITFMIYRAEEMIARGVHRLIEQSLARSQSPTP